MPIYEFLCLTCNRKVRLRLSYEEYDKGIAVCPICGNSDLRRRIGRVAIARSESSRLDNLMNEESLAGMEDDPRAMGRFMREMSQEMGEEMGDEFEEVASRLEKGESPESIERSMPDLGSTGDFGSDLF